MVCKVWCVMLAIVVMANMIAAEDWPQYRGPQMDGVSKIPGTPTTWNAESRIWKYDMPGPGASQPIVLDGKIYVTAYSGYGEGRTKKEITKIDPTKLMLHTVCINATDGSLIWQKDLKPLGPVFEPNSPIILHGYATPTPILDDGVLYAWFGPAGLFAMNPENGEVLWSKILGEECHRWGTAASLVTCDDMLIVNASPECHTLFALNKKTGDEIWKTQETLVTKSQYNRAWAAPMVIDPPSGKQVLLLGMDQLASIDPKTGKTLWIFPTRQGYSASNPLYRDGTIYAITGSGHGAWNSYALKPDPGLDRKERIVWKSADNGSGFSSPVILDDKIYYAAFTGKERPASAKGFCCMDAKTGEIIYKQEPEDWIREDIGRVIIYGAALTNGDYIYYPANLMSKSRDRTGGVYVVAARPEFELIALNEFADDASWVTSPLVPLEGGRLLIRSDKAIHCVGGK
ncbi:MAG: PQQ-binding-like beta-propeller repeat protein [bacterium]